MSIIVRLCATKQLFEQISCDDPDIENENEERDKKLWENMAMLDRDKKVWSKDDLTSGSKIVGRRVDVGEKQEYQLHEADIKVGTKGIDKQLLLQSNWICSV